VSGFFGILRQDGEPVSPQLLEIVSEKMSFRAPDGQNIWLQGNFGSCFAYMRTGPAKQAAQQPVTWCNRLWLWGDIRLDGREELWAQATGNDAIEAADSSDEELVLRAWAKWGADSLERLMGDFSFALWDSQESALWCARDFIGPRPFFYAHVGGVFCFSNTLQIMRAVPEVSGGLDECFIADFLLDGWSLDLWSTVYRDIKRVPAGHLLKLTGNDITLNRFRKLPIEEPLRLRRAEEYVECYRDLLHKAVKDRLPGEATSLYLSGGLDSGVVCAVASQIAAERGQQEKLRAFTRSWNAYFPDPEPALAKMTARHLGLAQITLEEGTTQLFAGRSYELGELPPEPDDEIPFARTRSDLLSVAAHSNVVLSGEGGDEILEGQSWPSLVNLWKRRQWQEIIRDFGGYLWRHKRLPPLRAGIRSTLLGFVKREDPLDSYPEWLNEDFSRRLNLKQRWLQLRASPQMKEHSWHPIGYGILHSGICARALEPDDAGWTHVNLENRAPFFDLRVLKFLLRLPPVPWCMNKELSRRAMEGILPATILSRPKTPLTRNPVETASENQQWMRHLPQAGPPQLETFVNWEKWCETLFDSKGSLKASILRPAILFFWLKAVESR
jgi:asparagine synthase (glutamine-hydrolysing)